MSISMEKDKRVFLPGRRNFAGKPVAVPKDGSVFLRRLRRFFLTSVIGGMAVVLPITIFVALLRFIVNLLTGILSPLVLLFPFRKMFPLAYQPAFLWYCGRLFTIYLAVV